MAKTSANEDALGTLHRLMTEQFLLLLGGKLTRPIFDKEGRETGKETLTATAAELSVIRAFLKDNEITAAMDEGSALDQLRQRLAQGGQGGKALTAQDFDLPGTVQ
jgi:hypothetical protein